MLDRRNGILERSAAIFFDLPRLVGFTEIKIETVARNVLATSEMRRPAIIVLDGDELTDDGVKLPPSALPLAQMLPQFHLLIGSNVAKVGTKLNLVRLAMIAAIKQDAEAGDGADALKQLIGTNGEARYLGLETTFAWGRDMSGEMVLRYRFKYPLLSRDLPTL